MGYVPLLTRLTADRAADAGIVGTVVKPGQLGNPFPTSDALVMDRWIATWITSGCPDALTIVLPRIDHLDILEVLAVWNSLLSIPSFKAEITNIRQTYTPEMFHRQIGGLHARILFMVLVHKMVRCDILHADTATASRTALPYFVNVDYHLAYEIQISGKIHPFLRPGFVLNPQWLSRRSRWSLTALHTLMCTLNRIGTWDLNRTWLSKASCLYGHVRQALYTRVPIGHLSSSPATMQQNGLYADPSITMLLSDAALNLVTIMRHRSTWDIYSRHNQSTFHHLLMEGGLRDLAQWRSWALLPVHPQQLALSDEPLYAPKLPATNKSSAISTLREVHFEMYKRWLSMNKSIPVESENNNGQSIYDAAFEPLETFMNKLFASVFDWSDMTMDANVVQDFKTHGHIILAQQPVVHNRNFGLISRIQSLNIGSQQFYEFSTDE